MVIVGKVILIGTNSCIGSPTTSETPDLTMKMEESYNCVLIIVENATTWR